VIHAHAVFFGTIAQNPMFISSLDPIIHLGVSSPGDPITLIKILFVNLILACIAAVKLMRRKNVELFITIEDFWSRIIMALL